MPRARIHVDFNDVGDSGQVVALRRHADLPSAVQQHSLVELWDEDGNTAQGSVVELQARDTVILDVIWDTWRTADAPTPAVPAGELGVAEPAEETS